MSPTKVLWTQNALADLESIRLYLAEHADEDVVLSEARRIWAACQRLKRFPESGRPGRVPMTREVIIPPYIIPYRVRGEVVELLNIFHSAQKP